MVIRAEDRVARVLEADERLLDVFTSASPHFERLRNPGMRRVMARIITVGQAARIAGIEPDDLLSRLNGALGEAGPAKNEVSATENDEVSITSEQLPPALAGIGPERISDLDVREELRRGEEPFSRIMTARQALPDGHVFRLRATFEPVPLYHVLGKQGFAHWTEELGPDDWRVWFYRPDAPVELPALADAGPAPEDESIVVLDVRGLEPPEPMVRTLAALETLPEGATLLQINVRVPQFLLPRLEEAGYAYEVREQNDQLVRVFIRRREAR
jgi:uncharacterized protein (DUF2249 family)